MINLTNLYKSTLTALPQILKYLFATAFTTILFAGAGEIYLKINKPSQRTTEIEAPVDSDQLNYEEEVFGTRNVSSLYGRQKKLEAYIKEKYAESESAATSSTAGFDSSLSTRANTQNYSVYNFDNNNYFSQAPLEALRGQPEIFNDAQETTSTSTDSQQNKNDVSSGAMVHEHTVSFSVDSQTVHEKSGTVTVTVNLAEVSSEDVIVPISFSGTASGGGVDYSFSGSSITIPAGALSASSTVTIVADAISESNETIILTIDSSDLSIGAYGTQTITISDLPVLTVSSASAYEGSYLSFTVVASKSYTSDITIAWTTTHGTTSSGDFSPTSGTATITAGQQSTTISVLAVDDTSDESSDETFTVTLSTADYAVIGTASATGTISDATLSLDFTTGSLSSLLTFTRAGTATYFGSDGLLKTAAVDTPRFDYNPSTLAAKGLLLENTRTNKLFRTESFDNASWTTSNSNITADTNETTAPDGTNSAEILKENAATNRHFIAQSGKTCAVGNISALSVYAKPRVANARNYLRLSIKDTTAPANSVTAGFYLVDGTTGNITNNGTGANASASTQKAANGWYRLILVGAPSTANSTTSVEFDLMTNFTTNSYAGDNTSGVYLWGAQLECSSAASTHQANATSYIPATAGVAVTRSSDVLSFSSISSWFDSTAWTSIFDVSRPSYESTVVSTFPRIATMCTSATCTNDRITFYYDAPNTWYGVSSTVSAVTTGSSTSSVANTVDSVYQLAVIKTSSSTLQIYNNGTAGTATSAISLPTVDTIHLAQSGVNNFFHLRKFTYRKRAVSSSAAIGLTSD